MSRPIFKLLTAFCVLAVLAVVVVVVVTLSQPLTPIKPMPNPNGYDDFVAAGDLLRGDPDPLSLTNGQLAAYLAGKATAISLVQTGLSRECRVPLVYSIDATHTLPLPALKQVAQLLAAQGKLAEAQGRNNDAAQSYLTMIRLGQESCRGGLIIHSLVGIAIEAMGDAHLESLIPKLSAAQSRAFATDLESIDSKREPTAATLDQELQWVRRTWGIKGRLVRLLTYKMTQQNEQKWKTRVAAQEARSQNVMLKLASHAYELENGKPPSNPEALVSDYLKSVPQSAVTNAPATR